MLIILKATINRHRCEVVLRATILAVIATPVAMSHAYAAPPCFPERSVVLPTPFTDEKGSESIGILRNGTQVTVVDDSDTLTSVVLIPEFGLRGRVPKDHLVVFPANDVEVAHGFTWLLHSHPVIVLSESKGIATIRSAEDSSSQSGDVSVSCTELKPEFTRTSKVSMFGVWCAGGAIQDLRKPAGKAAWIGASSVVTSDDGRATFQTSGPLIVGVVKKAADRSLVDIIDRGYAVRIRGWVASKEVEKKPSGMAGHGVIQGSCLDGPWDDDNQVVTIPANTNVYAGKNGRRIGSLTKQWSGREVRREKEWRQVRIGLPDFTQQKMRVALVVWISE